MIRKLLFVLLTLCFLVAESNQCNSQNSPGKTTLKNFDWLTGTWKREGRRGPVYEKWTKVSDHTFEGASYRISDGDTTITEILLLAQFGDEIYYIPKVAHNVYPVPFKLIKTDVNSFTFENSGHDFPKRILYKKTKDGSLHARIEGKKNGKQTGIDFFFKKIE